MGIKTVASYPLFFWPLCREVETYFAFEGSLAIELRLPWAIEKVQRQKTMMRIVLVVLTILPTILLAPSQFHLFKAFSRAVPVTFVQFVLPSLFAAVAIVKHWRMTHSSAKVAA